MALLVPLLAVPAGRVAAADAVATLTLAAARERALASSPSLRRARERAREAEFAARLAGAPPNPTLDVGHGFGTGATGTDEDLVLSQVFDISGKRRLRAREAAGESAAARLDEEQMRQDVLFEVDRAYFDAREAAAALALAREAAEVAGTFARLAQAQFEAGDVPRTHVVRSRIELSDVRQSLRAAETQWQTRRAVLNALLDHPAAEELVLAPAATVVLTGSSPEERAAAYRAVEERSDVRAARLRLGARQAGVAVAEAERRPDLVAQAAHGQLDERSGNVLRLGFVLPLWDGGRIRAGVDAARAAAAAQEADVETRRRQALLEVETAYQELEQARARVNELQSGPLVWTRELSAMVQIGYREGENSYLELLDAQRTQHATALAYIQAVAAHDRARATLAHAAGTTQ
jgi:outer membrane protein TolC